MQVTETLSEGLKRGFTVVVPGAEIETRRTARLADLGKTLRLPGFRPGKVPLPIIRQRYGTAVTAEVLEESVNQATQDLLTERKLRPAQTPKVDVLSMDASAAGAAKDLEFKLEFETLPDIPLPDFSQITLTRRKAEVSAEAVDKALAEIAARNRTLVEISAEELAARTEAPGAAQGEWVTIDYEGKLEGVVFPGGAAKDTEVEAGEATSFIPGFQEQLVGMVPGESKTIQVTFPEDYGNKELAGKPASFDVTAKKVSRGVVPAVDDELAQKLAFDELSELRSMIERRMQAEYDSLSRVRLKRDLLDALAEKVTFEAPQGMVDQEFEQIWQRLEAARKDGTLDEDDKDKDEATLRADYRAIAERRVKLGLVLADIGRANGITVTAEEMNRAKRVEASRYPGQEVQMMEFFRKYPQMEQTLRGPIFEEKTVDFVLELAKVTEEVVSPEELAQEPPAPVTARPAAGAGGAAEPAGAVVAAATEPAAGASTGQAAASTEPATESAAQAAGTAASEPGEGRQDA